MAHINNSSPLNQDRVVDKRGNDLMNFNATSWQITQGSIILNGHLAFYGTGVAQELLTYMSGSGAYQILPFAFSMKANTGAYMPKFLEVTIPYRYQFLEAFGGPSTWHFGGYEYPYTGSPETYNCTYTGTAEARYGAVFITITNPALSTTTTYCAGTLWVYA